MFRHTVKFYITTNEEHCKTTYNIDIDEKKFATVTYERVQFFDDFIIWDVDMRMLVLQLAWKEFNKRDNWSDFTFEFDENELIPAENYL